MFGNYGEFMAGIFATCFVISVFYILFLPKEKRFSKKSLLAWIFILIFLMLLIWSMWSETLYPLIKSHNTKKAISVSFGLLSIIFSVILIVYGGFIVVSRILKSFELGSRKIFKNTSLGFLLIILGFLLLSFGAFLMR